MKNFPKKLDSKTSSLRIRVPENLDLALEGLIRKVLREQPKTDDIYSFAADYFEALVKIRDRAGLKIVESQICPFHNDEDAHEMIKLANTFPKPPPTEVNFSSNERDKNGSSLTKTQTPNSKVGVFREKIKGKQVDGSEKASGKIINAGGSTKESLLEEKATNEAEGKIHQWGEEVEVEDDEEKFLRPDPVKELVGKELMEGKVGASAAENHKMGQPGGQRRKSEPEEDSVGEALVRTEESCVGTGNPSAAPEINDEKRKEARNRNENLKKINEVEKNQKTKVSSAEVVKEADKREEKVVEGHFGRIRERYETKTKEEEKKEEVKNKGEEKQSAQGNEEEKAGWGKATDKYDEDIGGSERTETNTEKPEDVNKMLGNQVQETEASLNARKESEERKAEAQAVIEEVEKKEVEEKADNRAQELAKEDEPMISEKVKDSGGESQRNMNEPNEKLASDENGKTFSEKSPQEESKILLGDKNERKIEQESGKEIRGTERTEEASWGSYDDGGAEKDVRNSSGAGSEVRGQLPEEECEVDEAAKSGSEEGKPEIETPAAGAEEAGNKEAVNQDEEQRVRDEKKEELAEDKEIVCPEKQEMKKYKDEQVCSDPKSPKAKIHDSEGKKPVKEMDSPKGEAEGETEKQNIAKEKVEKMERSLAVGHDEVKSGANEDVKEEDAAREGLGDFEPNPDTEHRGVENKVKETQVSGAIRKEDTATEARPIKSENDDALPSAMGSKENLNCEEVKKVQTEPETKDDEKPQTGKILHGLPENKDLNAAKMIDEMAVERKSQVLDFQEKRIVVGNVETQTRGENTVENQATANESQKSSAGDEISGNEKIEGSTNVDGGKEPGPEEKNNSTGNEEKADVKLEAETGGKSERETKTKRGGKEGGEGEGGEETCGVVDNINIIRMGGAEKMEEEPQYERQIKTIATHYYDSLQIPETETSEYRMGSANEGALSGEGKPDALAVPANAHFTTTPTSGSFVNLPHINSATASAIFLNNEKQYNSREKEKIALVISEAEEGGSRKGKETESKKEVEDAMRKTEASAEVGAVPSEPREPGQIEQDSAASEEKTKDKAEEEKSKGSSSGDSNEGASTKSTDRRGAFVSVEARTPMESRVSDGEEKEAEEGENPPEPEGKVAATKKCVPEAEAAAADKADVEEESSDKEASPAHADRTEDEDGGTRNSPSALEMEPADREGGSSGGSESALSSAETEIKRSDSGKKNFTRSSTQSLLTSRSLDSGRRNSLIGTRSLSTFRVGATDVEVWTTIEKELERAATKIQSKFRGYKARKKLYRENAVESSSSSPAEPERQQGTGEFHDSIVLSDPPR